MPWAEADGRLGIEFNDKGSELAILVQVSEKDLATVAEAVEKLRAAPQAKIKERQVTCKQRQEGIVMLLALAAITIAVCQNPVAELEKLQGRWVRAGNVELIIKGDAVALHQDGKEEFKGTLAIDAKGKRFAIGILAGVRAGGEVGFHQSCREDDSVDRRVIERRRPTRQNVQIMRGIEDLLLPSIRARMAGRDLAGSDDLDVRDVALDRYGLESVDARHAVAVIVELHRLVLVHLGRLHDARIEGVLRHRPGAARSRSRSKRWPVVSLWLACVRSRSHRQHSRSARSAPSGP